MAAATSRSPSPPCCLLAAALGLYFLSGGPGSAMAMAGKILAVFARR